MLKSQFPTHTRQHPPLRAPPPPHHDMLSLAPLEPGTIVAVSRTEDLASLFDIAHVLITTETHASLTYLGTRPIETNHQMRKYFRMAQLLALFGVSCAHRREACFRYSIACREH